MDKYYEIYGEDYCKQLELEVAYKTEAEELLKASIEKAQANGEAATTKIGGKLIDKAFDDVKANMMALIGTATKTKRGVVADYMPQLKECLKYYQPEALANLFTLSALSTLISNSFINRTSISAISYDCICEIEEEIKLEAFFAYKTIKEGSDKGIAALRADMYEGINKRVRLDYRKTYAKDRMTKEGFVWSKWSVEKLKLGVKIIEMALKGSGFFKEIPVDGEVTIIQPNEWLIQTWIKNTDLMAKYAHKFCPCLIPPKPWSTPDEGGYYGELSAFVSLLRLQRNGTETSSFTLEYKKKLHSVNLDYIYEALNTMQNTPFSINKQILEVVEHLLATTGGLGIPQTEPIPQLPLLTGEFTEKELKRHKRKMQGILKQNQARVSKLLRVTMSISTAKRFAECEKIYFPWNMDYRGRCYPIPTSLSPQGDDITKALLLFAEPKECTNESDYKWLAIHGANLAGHDKIPFNERIAWVQEHTKDILSSAKDPLGFTWWHKESENDYPLEFLAFCFEWQRLQEWLKTHKNCIGFKSGLPIAFDGTCSGLQHFSAILRDEVGGQAVNLLPHDKVQDIYGIVAEKVNKVLRSDCVKGSEDGYKRDKDGKYVLGKNDEKIIKYGSKSLAQAWIIFSRQKFGTEGITRKVCKRSVMTLAYGSGKYGFAENLYADIIRPYNLDHDEDTPFIAPKQSAQYLAGLIWDAVSTTVIKAVKGMDYLQKLAGLLCQAGAVVTWVTPNGLPVCQNYFKIEQKVFKMRFNGTIKRFYTQQQTFNIDKIAQRNAISPNFIHSLDASHLQRVVVESKRKGIDNFAMIHDSFGTDMASAGQLFVTVREEFVKLYKDVDHLHKFLEDVQYLLDDDVNLPKQPDFGKLNITDVLKSDFCFA